VSGWPLATGSVVVAEELGLPLAVVEDLQEEHPQPALLMRFRREAVRGYGDARRAPL